MSVLLSGTFMVKRLPITILFIHIHFLSFKCHFPEIYISTHNATMYPFT